MKINFDTTYGNQNVDNGTTAYGRSRVQDQDTKGGYQIDISGTVMDNNAYKGHGRTAEDVMEEAGHLDVAMQRNYMAVMSNSLSDEDFAKLQEEGFHPGSEDIERLVTIVDKIKAELIKSGESIKGYTDTIDRETLVQITGSEVYADAIVSTLSRYDLPPTQENVSKVMQAASEASQVNGLSEGAVKYMVQNEMEPTLQNMYLAQHGAKGQERSATGYYATGTEGYYAKKAEYIDWEQLAPGMEQVIEQAESISGEKIPMEEAKWLVEQGIELTAENLNRLHDIRKVAFPLQQEGILQTAAIAIADGKPADGVSVNQTKTAAERAADAEQVIEQADETAADLAAMETKHGRLHIKALREAMQKIAEGYDTSSLAKNIAARRVLEEVRLQMTLQANLKLIKSDYAIETVPLEQLVEDLKQAEQSIQSTLFGEADQTTASEKAALYEAAIDQAAYLPSAPAAVIGKIAGSYEQTTLSEVTAQAKTLQKSYEQAEKSYETLMTQPRRDLGDSIRKAFRNVDDMLKDLGLEATDLNRRAVRILGYNSMEITPENIAKVKAADLVVRDVVEKMTPSAVLQMIRDGQDPLSMTISELDSYFSEQKEGQQEMERYSRYLYQLEQNKEITEEEKTSYIGVYRMLRQLEKNDGAAVGSVVEQGLELTFSNLLSAVRTAKKGGMDYTVDDSIGSVEKKATATPDITSQIQTAYDKQLQNIQEQLTPHKLMQAGFTEDMSVEAFYEAIQRTTEPERKQEEAAYREEQISYVRQAAAVSEAAVEQLLTYGQPVTADFALAAQLQLYQRGNMWKKALAGQDRRQLEQDVEKLKESFNSSQEAGEAYTELTEQTRERLQQEVLEEAGQSVDVKAKLLLHKQLAFSTNMAQEESYEIPVMINGSLTSINLKVIHEEGKQSKAAVTMETEDYGKAAGEFTIQKNGVSGYLSCDSSEGQEYLEGVKEKLQESLEQAGYQTGSLCVIKTEELDLVKYTQKETESRQQAKDITQEQRQDSSGLYQIAKLFLKAL